MTAAIIIRQTNAVHLVSDGISHLLRDGQVSGGLPFLAGVFGPLGPHVAAAAIGSGGRADVDLLSL